MANDKCNVCGWIGDEDEVIKGTIKEKKGHMVVITGFTWACPQCGSNDLDDEHADPYEDGDEGLLI